MSTKAEQRERTHESIIDSACKLLRAKGIGGARVAEVMGGIGLTVGGFYAHFPSKEALVDEAIRRTALAMRSKLFTRIEDKPEEFRAEVVLKRYLSAAHRDDPETGCPLPAIAGEVSTSKPEHREVVAEQISALADELVTHLVTPSAPSAKRSTALAMIALMYGGLSLSRAVRGTALSDEILKACRSYGRGEQ